MSLPAVRTSALNAWLQMAPLFGMNAGEIAQSIGMAAAADGASTILLRSFTALTEKFASEARQPALGWLVGSGIALSGLDEVGEAILCARTVGSALRRLCDNFELLQDSTRLSLEVRGSIAAVSYRILDPDIWPRHQDATFSLAIVARIIQSAIPDARDAFELGLECGRCETGLANWLNQISFDGEANLLLFPAAMLDAAMPATDRACDMRGLAARVVAKRKTASASRRLAPMIFARLPLGEINQDELASEIGMSSRTMRRRLSDERMTFQQLLDECRMRQAMLEFRSRPDCSIAQIALRLGYAEHSNFTRAFTRWAGVPPHKFRSRSAPAEY